MIVGTSDQYLVVSTHDHEDAPLCGVVDWYGIADLVALGPVVGGPMEHDSVESPEGRLIGGRVSANPELARAASPVSYVHPGAPPFQIKHGLADAGVPAAQSQALASLLTDAGVDVETEWVEGADHMWMGASPEQVEAIFESSLSFARKVTGL
jgi:dipeptidyl aminopeptidase/acylaminoacyl peptidase